MTGSLAGRTALVTGASRRRGIGYATAVELASRGANVVIHHFAPHDRDQPWGVDDLDAVRRGVDDALAPGARMADVSADLADAEGPARVVREAAALTGSLDILVCNQARSGGKAALAGITRTVASELLPLGIILNTINPGPVNTGYLDPETTDRPLDDITAAIAATPFGRVGVPSDPARLIAWLASPEGSWVAGQVLTSDGGFSIG